MKRFMYVALVVAGLVWAVAVGAARAEDKPAASPKASAAPAASPKAPAAPAASAAPKSDKPGDAPVTADGKAVPPEFVEVMKLAIPNEHHQGLATLVGKWKAEMVGQMPGQTEKSKDACTAEYGTMLGGRYVSEHVSCGGSIPFEWHGCYGYDNTKKKYWGLWIDNMHTGYDQAEGDSDTAGKVVTLRGEMQEPDGTKSKYAWIVTLPDKDSANISMTMPGPDGKEMEVIKMTMTRDAGK